MRCSGVMRNARYEDISCKQTQFATFIAYRLPAPMLVFAVVAVVIDFFGSVSGE